MDTNELNARAKLLWGKDNDKPVYLKPEEARALDGLLSNPPPTGTKDVRTTPLKGQMKIHTGDPGDEQPE